jgi:hypothetical protein
MNPPPNEYQAELDYNSNTIIGFKTIRFVSGNINSIESTRRKAKFLQQNFPCSKILINYRSDVTAQVKSFEKAFNWQGDIESKARNWNHVLQDTYTYLSQNGTMTDQVYLLDSSKWTKDLRLLNEAVSWLGFSKECYFERLLELNTKGRGYNNGNTKLEQNQECKYAG